MDITEEIESKLAERAGESIKKYDVKIISSAYSFLGVAIPEIRKLVKEYAACAEKNFDDFRPVSFEGVLLKGLLIGFMKCDFEPLWNRTYEYLLLCDNWAHIDCFFSGLKVCKRYSSEFNKRFKSFASSDNIFLRRAVAVFNMNFRLDSEHFDEALLTLYSIKSGDYYCDMAVAWALATAFAKDYEKTLEFLRLHRFSPEIEKMTTGKCRDSFRLTKERKAEIKELLFRRF